MKYLFTPALLPLLFGVMAAETSPLKQHDANAIVRATESVSKGIERAKADPNRPTYHITSPANWINDPNGPLFHNGYWHMFYQHNPYGDEWGNMHWGHVRSEDMAHWEHLPIALWPSKEVGEDHVFSGCAAVRADGRPVIFYTSIGRGKSAGEYAEQWMALGDKDLIKWEKPSSNPALSEELHGNTKIWDWRDPFLFKYKGADYMVLGGNLNKGGGGEAIVALYKAKDRSLENWEYLGILFKHPAPKVTNIECPNFFELNGRWVLIVSPHRRVEYFVGAFDGQKFTPQSQGLLDHSDSFYAPNSTTDPKGRRLLWGWIRGFKGGQGWNGVLTAPRVLRMTEDGILNQAPADEVVTLRHRELFAVRGYLTSKRSFATEMRAPRLEISAEMSSGNNSGMRLFKTSEHPGFEIFYSNGELRVGEKKVPLTLGVNDPLQLYVLVDHSVIEVFANSTLCFTQVHYPPAYAGDIEFFATGEGTHINASVDELEPAWDGVPAVKGPLK